FVMNVTAQIGEDDVVVLNVRPTVSSIIGYVNDPNPDLAKAGVVSQVPEIQSREFESVMRVPSGQTAILGGLMQDRTETKGSGLPVLSRFPFFGDRVSYRSDTTRKNELVVFFVPSSCAILASKATSPPIASIFRTATSSTRRGPPCPRWRSISSASSRAVP